jgi:hypothetical protein
MGGLAGVTESSRSLSAASATGRRRRGRTLELRVGFRPAASGELGGDAGGEEHQTDGEGAEDPSQLHAALEHEPVEQGQDQDKNRCLGEERGAAMRGDCSSCPWPSRRSGSWRFRRPLLGSHQSQLLPNQKQAHQGNQRAHRTIGMA